MNSVSYPSLGEPPPRWQDLSIGALVSQAEKDGANISSWAKVALWIKDKQESDNVAFRFFEAPPTSALDAANVAPFTPLATLPSQTVSTDPKSPFPIRGWLKLAWVSTDVIATTGGGVGTS